MDRADLAIKMSKLVHDKCKDVPHDIGLQLLYLIEEYDGAFRQPLVSGSLPPDQIIWPDVEKTKELYRNEYNPDCTGRDEDVIEWTLNNVQFRRQ